MGNCPVLIRIILTSLRSIGNYVALSITNFHVKVIDLHRQEVTTQLLPCPLPCWYQHRFLVTVVVWSQFFFIFHVVISFTEPSAKPSHFFLKISFPDRDFDLMFPTSAQTLSTSQLDQSKNLLAHFHDRRYFSNVGFCTTTRKIFGKYSFVIICPLQQSIIIPCSLPTTYLILILSPTKLRLKFEAHVFAFSFPLTLVLEQGFC